MSDNKASKGEKVAVALGAIGAAWLFLFILLPLMLIFIFIGASCAASI